MEMRKNLFIEKDLWNEFKAVAARNGTTIKEEVAKLMKERVEREYGGKELYKNS